MYAVALLNIINAYTLSKSSIDLGIGPVFETGPRSECNMYLFGLILYFKKLVVCIRKIYVRFVLNWSKQCLCRGEHWVLNWHYLCTIIMQNYMILPGQGAVLHVSVTIGSPSQSRPSLAGTGWSQVRVRFRVPLPHVWLQGPSTQAPQPPST